MYDIIAHGDTFRKAITYIKCYIVITHQVL
jgi:hypothetical protein